MDYRVNEVGALIFTGNERDNLNLKELSKEVDKLKKENTSIKKQLKELKKTIEELGKKDS